MRNLAILAVLILTSTQAFPADKFEERLQR